MRAAMRAAIYARKSTRSHSTDPELKSCTRQIENAKKFGVAKGWTVDDTRHHYADDAVSGAYWLKLVNRQRLLDAIKRHEVDVLIVRDEDRFSRRDGWDAVAELTDIARTGVDIWFYSTGQKFTYGELVPDMINMVKAHGAADERKKTGVRVKEFLTHRAEAGHVASGKVYGYDNVRHGGHAEYEINPQQAAVVVTIFQLAAKGYGYHKIAKHLSDAKVPTIRPAASMSDGWSGASIRHILHRPNYRGLVIWNRTRKLPNKGKPVIVQRPKSEWIQVPKPSLRIVDEVLYQAVQRQLTKRSSAYDMTSRRRPVTADLDSQYLLTGFARCTCGSGMHVRKRTMAGGVVVAGYACTRHFNKGKSNGCTNGRCWDMDALNRSVVDAMQLQLTPDRVNRVLAKVRQQFDARRGADPAGQLRADLAKVVSKMERLADAIENGGGTVPMLADRLKAADLQRQQLAADLASAELRTAGPTKSWTDVDRIVRKNLATWTTQLAADLAAGRPDAIRKARDCFRLALTGPVVFRPTADGLAFSGQLALSVLFGGVVVTDRQSTSSSSVDYTPVFQGVFRQSRRKAA